MNNTPPTFSKIEIDTEKLIYDCGHPVDYSCTGNVRAVYKDYATELAKRHDFSLAAGLKETGEEVIVLLFQNKDQEQAIRTFWHMKL